MTNKEVEPGYMLVQNTKRNRYIYSPKRPLDLNFKLKLNVIRVSSDIRTEKS